MNRNKNERKNTDLEHIILRCTKSGNYKEFVSTVEASGHELLRWRHTRSGDTCLLLCARYGHVHMLRYLVEECAQCLEQWNNDGKRALHEAVLAGHTACVIYLISRKVEIDSLKRADWTPLMLACTKDCIEIIKELLKAGANPYLRNKDGWNSFHIAAREGHVNIIQYFLDEFPDIWNSVSNNGRTPLHTAALYGHYETVQCLLERANFPSDRADSCGCTPLMESCKGNCIEVVKLLITKQQASPVARDKLGRQCAHMAVLSDSLLPLKYLVEEMKVDVTSSVDYSGMTALHIAAKEGNDEAVNFLLKTGSDVNRQDKNGRTALHLASAAGHPSVVYRLVNFPGCNVTLIDIKKATASELALKREVKQIFHELQK
ncbi:ankyrin repeat domain-containing protein 16-like [Xenia sp. Carnegie-2017]|uniref:ankyrin repeat domain-containing protein 16-like n=1 Tax=Xenia sp. Carnegie-2017 TaxID=2897299 RepID=UPI001F04BB58|nr:ankyrin repeat domain-containing protein 16-like [Xenia sp. Carnegie-2017]